MLRKEVTDAARLVWCEIYTNERWTAMQIQQAGGVGQGQLCEYSLIASIVTRCRRRR
jgi:hypothetical protein